MLADARGADGADPAAGGDRRDRSDRSDRAALEIVAHQGHVLFGLARRDITPPVGIYGRWWPRATWDRVTGVHRPLTATAVVLRNQADFAGESDEEIIVALDLCILYAREQEALLADVRRLTGVTGQLMCHYSH